MKDIFKINITNNRIYGLDILRCLAILFVVIGHGNYLLSSKIAHYISYFVFDGVSVFFVLSGFLIGGILIKEFENKNISLKLILNFWQRRWFRTLPNYFLILIVLVILQIIFKNNFSIKSISSYFIFSQNLFYPQPDWFFPEAWSLTIEEWFYLITPLLIIGIFYTMKLQKKKAIISVSISLIMAVTLFRLLRYNNFHITNYSDWDSNYRKQVITRLDSLMYGVIGSYISFYNKTYWLKYKKGLLYTGILLLLLPKLITFSQFNSFYFCVFSFSINSIGTLFLLPYLSDLKKGKGYIFKIVTYLSLISYSMYLINLSLVQRWIICNLKIHCPSYIYTMAIEYSLYWFLTILISILLYKYYEVPMTKLRDRIN